MKKIRNRGYMCVQQAKMFTIWPFTKAFGDPWSRCDWNYV